MDERASTADLERRLAESETRHRRLIDSWAQAVWETDADGVVVADSPSWRAYTGQTLEEWLGYGWLNAIHPDKLPRRGFGSELIEARIPYELKGRGQITIEARGAQCHLEFPLKHGASVLEAGAPQTASVLGGALDMTGEANLTGHRVLVVEDDYYLATDAARALQGAGAEVIGPCPTEEDARAELRDKRPDAVLLDINLGHGATFKLAEHLKDSGIPFVFVTGYDQNVIPAEFDAVERVEKPVQLRQVVAAVSRIVTPTS